MRWREAEGELEKYVQTRRLGAPADAVRAMLDFYRDVRASDCAIDSDGDMLLFQWGTYDWGEGRNFELDITRQFIGAAAEDEDVWQLHLTFRFASSEDLTALGSGNRWCNHPRDLTAFESHVVVSPAFDAVSHRTDGRMARTFECAG